MSSSVTRRRLLIGGLAVTATGLIGVPPAWRILRQPRARVGILRAPSYDVDLVDLLTGAIREYPAVVERAKGGLVVLKPNLVEYHPERPINTDPRLVVAAAEAFRGLGAKEVVVAEGPGHRRDTELVVEHTGLREQLGQTGHRFVDLNIDVPTEVALPAGITGAPSLQFGGHAVGADLLVSMPKLKTHHWAGATLSMKNLFGTIPGAVYGWPKNPLHRLGVVESTVDIWRALQPGFAIVDGIVGMEGDGPIMGSAVEVGAIVVGDQLPAVDATCARLMGLVPERIPTLQLAARYGGTVSEWRIETIGDAVDAVPFDTLPYWGHIRS